MTLKATSIQPTLELCQEVIARRAQHLIKYPGRHDDAHRPDKLVDAAVAFALNNPAMWPFLETFQARPARRENLIEAIALLLAEVEREDRLAVLAGKLNAIENAARQTNPGQGLSAVALGPEEDANTSNGPSQTEPLQTEPLPGN